MLIQIVVDGNGNVSYNPSPDSNNPRVRHKVKTGTIVEWECQTFDLAIVFVGGQTPFKSGDTQLFASAGASTGNEQTTKTNATYEYVIVLSQPNGPVWKIIDPDLEVSDTNFPNVRTPKKKTAAKKKKKTTVAKKRKGRA